MSFLQLKNRVILVMGVANRKSVAYHIARTLEEAGAKVLYSVRSEERKESVARLLEGKPLYICDVESKEQIETLAKQVTADYPEIHGIVHSIAFANYSEGLKPFHETNREDFLQATQISCFSIVEIVNVFKSRLSDDASILAIGISSHQMTAENYGYMSPIKAALDGTMRYLAKSFSKDTNIRFNTVNPSLLKTSASAGIPGYLESYLFSEIITFRGKAVQTQEVANVGVFLLSPRSSGINGGSIKVDAGMDCNYFDKDVIRLAMRPDNKDN
ncbi:MAG: enoyl-ACP reductase [Opitutaceae bacterium]|nr:enoyl-ACP reductase [Opitutaceae bacterium]|tara:strand:+ start:2182 stop:2997 length:816 start_codon:yes stop_codon:yes gene_type:complete